MEQLELFGPSPIPPVPGLGCASGRPWPTDATWDGPNHCAGCHETSERLCAEFDRLVADGTYNWLGYTRAEWTKAGHPADTWKEART